MIISQSKWPPQLRMPSRELQGLSTTPFGVSSTLLKRHKTLPHPRGQEIANTSSTPPTSKPRVLTVDTGIPSSPTSQSSSPRTLKHASRRIGLPDPPPTPPIHSRQSSSGQTVLENTVANNNVGKAPSLPTTPTNPQSPPTPDVTPPRPTVRSTVSRPPITHRYSSSRNDSFKTARENLSSEDEDDLSTVRPALPSARPSEVEVPQMRARPHRPREIGLGLGLESENDGTPSPKSSKRDGQLFRAKAFDDFRTFDGEWGSTGESEVEREWDHNLMRNVTVRKRRPRDTHLYNGVSTDEILDNNQVTPTPATKLLRRIPLGDDFATRTTNLQERDCTPTSESTARPATAERDIPTTSDIRRFSALSARSANSAVVEAMVVDALPQRRKTLRHTKKQLSLREFVSHQAAQRSVTDPYLPNNLPHRLIHKSSGIFSRKHLSVESGATTSTSSSTKSRQDILNNGSIPVVVVPERRSSVKSARTPSLRSTSSRRTKRSMSLNSTPLSQSSKSNGPVYVEIPKRNPRRLSESAASSADRSQRTIDFPPRIPARRSSLSAPTSRNTSRAGSLTAESLRAHNFLQADIERPPPFEVQISDFQKDTVYLPPRTSADRRGSVDHNGDPFFGNRLSAQVTPFSQASYETTGTAAEVAQATSVQLYPHHNKSVLLVEQVQFPAVREKISQEGAEQPKVIVNDTKMQEPLTPPQPQRQDTEQIDSPLRNPRNAPQPPAIKFIPPTPNNLTPAQEEDRQLGLDDRPSTADAKPGRGMSMIRRALTNRRHSISAVARTFSIKRGKDSVDESTQTAKGVANPPTIFPSVMDQPADGSKLHPFWRPARFWDDLEDDDYEQQQQQGDRDLYAPMDRRPPPPKRSISTKLKRTFAILPIRDEDTYVYERRTVRRTGSGNLRVVKGRGSTGSLRRAVSDSRAYYTTETRNSNQDLDFGQVFDGIRGLGRRMSERRRERRNEKLRKTISGPRNAIDGVARMVVSDSSIRKDT